MLRKLSLLIAFGFTFALTTSAHAATTATAPDAIETSTQPRLKKDPTRGFRALLGMHMTNNIEAKVVNTSGPSTESLTAEGELTRAPNIGVGYIERTPKALGWNTSLSYEFPRKGKGASSDDGTKISALVAELGGNYSIDPNFYMGAGANVSRPFVTNDGGLLKEQLGLGFQILAGYQNESGLGVELSYRALNYKNTASLGGVDFDVNYKLQGINLGLNYLF